MSDFTKSLELIPAFDKRDPDPQRNYGVGCSMLGFVLKGPKGAVRWAMFTGLNLPHVVGEHVEKLARHGLPAGKCALLRTLTCGGLTAENVFDRLAQQREALAQVGIGFPEDIYFRAHDGPVSYHSPAPLCDWQTKPRPDCPYLDGRPCYHDGSALAGEDVMEAFRTGGQDAVWRWLEAYYRDTFGRE